MVNSKDVIRPNLSVREGIGNPLISPYFCLIQLFASRNGVGSLFLPKDTKIFYANFAEIVVSGGMSMPQILSTLDPQTILGDRSGPSRS
jgi:hypothetical protein